MSLLPLNQSYYVILVLRPGVIRQNDAHQTSQPIKELWSAEPVETDTPTLEMT